MTPGTAFPLKVFRVPAKAAAKAKQKAAKGISNFKGLATSGIDKVASKVRKFSSKSSDESSTGATVIEVDPDQARLHEIKNCLRIIVQIGEKQEEILDKQDEQLARAEQTLDEILEGIEEHRRLTKKLMRSFIKNAFTFVPKKLFYGSAFVTAKISAMFIRTKKGEEKEERRLSRRITPMKESMRKSWKARPKGSYRNYDDDDNEHIFEILEQELNLAMQAALGIRDRILAPRVSRMESKIAQGEDSILAAERQLASLIYRWSCF